MKRLVIILWMGMFLQSAGAQQAGRYDVDASGNMTLGDVNALSIGLSRAADDVRMDVNRNGEVSVADLTLLINRLLGNINYPVSALSLPANLMLMKDSTATLSPAVSPEDPDIPTLRWRSMDETIATVDGNGVVTGVEEGLVAIVAETTDGSGVSATCLVDVTSHEYVDLALPSGTLWATTNIGAATPTDDGNFYAWGETYVKTYYSFNGYFDNTFTRYTMTGKTELDSSDDAAYVEWGNRWRMPTKEQEEELLNNCFWIWCDGSSVKYNDTELKGYMVTGGNGNTLFLPASGMSGLGGFVANHGQWGYYWSRTLDSYEDSDGNIKACSLNVSEKRNSVTGTYRYDGKSVRAIRVRE